MRETNAITALLYRYKTLPHLITDFVYAFIVSQFRMDSNFRNFMDMQTCI